MTSRVNLDTVTGFAFVSYGSPVRTQLEIYVGDKQMIMCQTAYEEFTNVISQVAGPFEQAEAARFLTLVTVVPDAPSSRARALTPTRNLQPNDIVILGTGDRLAITTMTADGRAVKAAAAQGVDFAVYLHVPVPLTGR
jgi:hypothetical protein